MIRRAQSDDTTGRSHSGPLLGAHMSIAGGYHKAVLAAAELRMDTCQIFTKNNNQWNARSISADEVALFRDAVASTGLKKLCAHTSYLINLASPDDELWQKSLDAFVVELQRAEALGLAGLVIHPGSYVNRDDEEESGLDRVVTALEEALDRTAGAKVEIWLETTAGQGTNLGYCFEHLRYLLNAIEDDARLGVCVDTCHIFAAGYPLRAPRDYAHTMAEFHRLVGVERIRAFHLNDSKKPLGSRVDRHEHIGEGCLGREPFRHILNDSRFAHLPMYLETPKGENEKGQLWDAVNLAKLRRMIRKKPPVE